MSIIKLLFGLLFCLLHFSNAEVIFNTTRISSARDGLSLVEAGSDLYFVGGLEYHTTIATDVIEVFDLTNRTWKNPLTLPSKRAFVTPVVIDPHIYFVGGFEYVNPPYVFDPVKQEFLIDHGQGPTVSYPESISIHESTLTVMGIYSVDFLDLTTRKWNHSAELTSVKMNLFDSAFFTYEDIVVIIGGTNVTSNELISTAWIYNRTTDYLDVFPAALTLPFSFPAFEFSVTNRIISIWTEKGSVVLHQLGSRDWHQLEIDSIEGITNIFSSQTVTFIFKEEAYIEFFWSNTSLSILTQIPNLKYPFAVDGYVGYIFSARDSVVYYYDDSAGSWSFIAFPTEIAILNKIEFSVVTGEWACFASSGEVAAVNIRKGAIAIQDGVSDIVGLFPGNNSCHFIDNGALVQRVHFQFQGDEISFVEDEFVDTRFNPVALIGDTFFTGSGGVAYGNMTIANYVQLISFPVNTVLWTASDEHFVLMQVFDKPKQNLRQFYPKVDIYNIGKKQWTNSTNLPFSDAYVPVWYLSATALGGKLVVWKDLSMAIYDPQTEQWEPVVENGTVTGNPNGIPEISNAHIPVLTFNDTAYLRALSSFTRHQAESPEDWTTTKSADVGPFGVFAQYFALGDDRIFISSRMSDGRNPYFSQIFTYDRNRDYFDISLLPRVSSYLTLVPVGQFIVGFSPLLSLIFYYEVSSGQWYEQPYDSRVLPASVYQTSQQLSVVVGGKRVPEDREIYSDVMLLFEHGSITIPPASPVASNETSGPTNGLSDGELAAAIVVPVGAALIAGALVLILLLQKKRKQKRARGESSTTTGLATRHGQWFIPFDQIKFGEQIGRGASGQVFKGSWKGSSVALKVSMTQANSTVISELELMMQMRPHPNVVQLFGFSVHPETDSIILAIEFCDGGSLDDLLFESNVPISMEQKTALLLGIASGLNHLHSNNIVHRDVASRNVLIHKNEAKLTDFGMSRLIDEDNQRGTTKSELGPIRWMAPESLKSKEYSVKSGTYFRMTF